MKFSKCKGRKAAVIIYDNPVNNFSHTFILVFIIFEYSDFRSMLEYIGQKVLMYIVDV